MIESSSHRPPAFAPALWTLAAVALLIFLAIFQLQPPAPEPASAPPAQFSAARALTHIRAITRQPHPTGSTKNARVREYLVAQLTALGLDPQLQTATAVHDEPQWHAPPSAATVANIVARLKGTANTRAVMLSAHYDSVPTGPGASDDGSGVATLLETARALKAGTPLRNDVIFLFTDGEELGLVGAEAFVRENPAAKKDVGVDLNFEARGACGPSFMFETSAGNGELIRQFAAGDHDAAASSMMDAVYKRLPNRTDLTVFKRAGLAGLNFAYVGCWPRYHTARDDVAHLDLASLQHDGTQALALARQFGNLDLSRLRSPDVAYFSVFGRVFYYPESWARPLAVALVILFALVIELGRRKKILTLRGKTVGMLGWLLAAVASALVSDLAWLILRRTPLVSPLPYGMAYNGELYAAGFIALTVAVDAAIFVRLRARTSVENLTLGALSWWATLAVVTSFYFPGASYLFVWPLFASLIELGWHFHRRQPESEAESAVVWTLPAVAGILLFAPIVYELLILLSTVALVPLVVVAALLLGFLTPQIHILTLHDRGWLARGAAIAGLGLIAAAMFTSGYNANRPRATSLAYALDADTAKAQWVSTDGALNWWTAQFWKGGVSHGSSAAFLPLARPIIEGPAPLLSLEPPGVATLDDVTFGASRSLRLWIISPRQARVVWVSIEGTTVTDASLNGVPIPKEDVRQRGGPWGFSYVGAPKDGITLDLSVPSKKSFALRLADQSDGLPQIPGVTFEPMPPDFMPAPSSPFIPSALVTRTFQFEAKP